MTTTTASSAQVENELTARAAVTPAALDYGRLEGAHSQHALTQALIASNLALLDEAKRTNRLLIASMKSDYASQMYTVRRVESDMNDNAAALAEVN